MHRCTWMDWIRDYYVIVFKRFRFHASTRKRYCCVFKSFHSGDRFQKVAFSMSVFAGYVWTEGEPTKKTLHFQTNPYTSGRGQSPLFLRFKTHSSKSSSKSVIFVFLPPPSSPVLFRPVALSFICCSWYLFSPFAELVKAKGTYKHMDINVKMIFN